MLLHLNIIIIDKGFDITSKCHQQYSWPLCSKNPHLSTWNNLWKLVLLVCSQQCCCCCWPNLVGLWSTVLMLLLAKSCWSVVNSVDVAVGQILLVCSQQCWCCCWPNLVGLWSTVLLLLLTNCFAVFLLVKRTIVSYWDNVRDEFHLWPVFSSLVLLYSTS